MNIHLCREASIDRLYKCCEFMGVPIRAEPDGARMAQDWLRSVRSRGIVVPACSSWPQKYRLGADHQITATGPEPTLATPSNAALRRHRTSLSCIAQHFVRLRGRSANFAAIEMLLRVTGLMILAFQIFCPIPAERAKWTSRMSRFSPGPEACDQQAASMPFHLALYHPRAHFEREASGTPFAVTSGAGHHAPADRLLERRRMIAADRLQARPQQPVCKHEMQRSVSRDYQNCNCQRSH